MVLSKWRWIQRALERRRLMENRDTAPGLSGQLVYLGERLPIVYGQTPGNRSTAVLEKGRMEILLTPSDSALAEKDRLPLVEQLLAQWQLEESQRIMDPVCQHYFSIFEPLGCKMPQIRYRRMKSQWGSYNRRTHVVTINTRLLAYPLACVEYVVLHELTHMLYPDHQQGFHRFMASAMPDYRERRALLRSAV